MKWTLPILLFSLFCRAENVLLVSDIHFDPLADRSLVSKLIEQPVSKWDEIFKSSSKKNFSTYRNDTNYRLWQSSLEAMKQNASEPSLVLVGGDFFRHTFRAEFGNVFKENKGDAKRFNEIYAQFQQKTIQFLVQDLVRQFPDAQFIPVIGNNESTCGDYMVFLNDPFLKEFAKVWQSATKQSIPEGMSNDFASSGHFTATLRGNEKLRLIVANDIFLTPEYNGRCGNSMVAPALGELAWIDQQLAAAEKAKEKVWLITHIPPGVDVIRSLYKSLVSKDQKVWLMLKDDYNQKYLDILHRHAKTILFHFTGHNHFADFRIPGGEVPVMMMPSISPDKLNNPAFQVLDFDSQQLKVKNLAQYALNLGSSVPAWTKVFDFDQAFEQKEISLATLKATATALRADQFSESYMQYSTSNSEAKEIAKHAIHVFVCGITQMSVSSFEKCTKSTHN